MNEARNLPFHLPLSYPSPLQVEAEGSGGGGPGLREALERGYVTRAHKSRVGKRRERNPLNSPRFGGRCTANLKYFDQEGQLHMGTRLGKGPPHFTCPGTQAVGQSGAPGSRWGGEYRELLWDGEAED